MPRNKEYAPKVNDHVLLESAIGMFIVTIVDAKRRTAGVRTVTGHGILYYDVAWSKLSALNESHWNAPGAGHHRIDSGGTAAPRSKL